MLQFGMNFARACIRVIRDVIYANLETEGGLNLAQENGYLLVLEQGS